MDIDPMLKGQINRLSKKLDERGAKVCELDKYYDGDCPIPQAVVDAKVTNLYRVLMPMSEAPWGSLVVDSVQDRLEVTGIRSGQKGVDEAVWGVWQDNKMDAESKLGHNAALIGARAFALVWPDENGEVAISLDSAEQMIVEYRQGPRRRERAAALRKWKDDDGHIYAVLYRPEGLYKVRSKAAASDQAVEWEMWDVTGEDWPLENPYGVVPVVELPVNQRLKAGYQRFGYARGEFEHCTGLIDRINLLTFLGLVVALWMGFPVRGIIGDRIIKDDEGKEMPPFEAKPNAVVQFENPNVKTFEFAAADRKNLSIYSELDQLATITKTPRHYLPMENGMSNLSADAIRASEGGLVAKVPSLKGSLGEGWEEVLRLSGLMLEQKVELSPRAELQWTDHESRSLAERADAVSKLKDVLPWQAVAEKALSATQEELSRWSSQRAADGISQIFAAANSTSTPGTANGAVPAAAGR